nr:hypothetical protein [Streptomyces sp. SID3343]
MTRDIIAKIDQAAKGRKIRCRVSGRVKDPHSFVTKSIAKGYQDPWRQITDKSGVRIILDHPGEITPMLDLVVHEFEAVRVEDTRDDPDGIKQLSYPKVHVQIADPFPESRLGVSETLECEIQIRTDAQDLWARMSHAMLYKPQSTPPLDVRRSLYRLIALVELYDAEVERGVRAMTENPAYIENQLFDQAERIFRRYVSGQSEREISEAIIPVLASTIEVSNGVYFEKLNKFVAENLSHLRSVYERYAEKVPLEMVERYIAVGQPESIIIFERLSAQPFYLKAKWSESSLPLNWLESAAEAWGVVLDE